MKNGLQSAYHYLKGILYRSKIFDNELERLRNFLRIEVPRHSIADLNKRLDAPFAEISNLNSVIIKNKKGSERNIQLRELRKRIETEHADEFRQLRKALMNIDASNQAKRILKSKTFIAFRDFFYVPKEFENHLAFIVITDKKSAFLGNNSAVSLNFNEIQNSKLPRIFPRIYGSFPLSISRAEWIKCYDDHLKLNKSIPKQYEIDPKSDNWINPSSFDRAFIQYKFRKKNQKDKEAIYCQYTHTKVVDFRGGQVLEDAKKIEEQIKSFKALAKK